MPTPTTQGAMQPDDRFPNTGQGDRTYRNAGLAIVGIGIVVTIKDPWVREVCARVLRDPEVRDACRELVARIVQR